MSKAVLSKTIGKWRLVEADLWDADYLNMLEPAFIAFKKDGHGEFRFGCVNAGLDCEYSLTTVHFTWHGFDEMDEVCGDGFAEFNDDGTLSAEIAFHLGDEATFKAQKW
jgi:hypothetical protein